MKKALKILFACMFIMGFISTSALTSNEAHASTDPSLVFRIENQDINTGSYPDLNDKVDVLKTLDEGTIVVKFRYTGDINMSLFSLSNKTVFDGHFHLYISPSFIGSENRYAGPDQSKSNIHIKSDPLTLSSNVDHTVAMVVDKNAGYKFFLDGILIKQDTTSPRKFLSNIYNPNSSKVGITERANGGFQYPFTGHISFIEVYNKPLSDTVLIDKTTTVNTNTDLNTIKAYINSKSASSTFLFTGGNMTFASGLSEGYRNYIQHFEERIRWEIAANGSPLQRRNFVFNTQSKGMTASELLTEFNKRVTQFQPKTVFVNLGYDDAIQKTNIETYKASLKSIVSQIRGIGAVPVLQTPIYPSNPELANNMTLYVNAMKVVAQEDNVLFMNNYETWKNYNDRVSVTATDGVTPNELGHLRLAKELMSFLSIGGSGNVWNINGFNDTKEPQVLDQSVSSSVYQSVYQDQLTVPEELTALLQGSKPVTWLFTGDSITHGALHTKGYKSFVQLFEERVKGELSEQYPARAKDIVLNTGVSSMTSRDLMENFDRWVTLNKPDVVFIAFGMNDSSNIVPLNEYITNLQTAVDRVREMGAIPVLETINTVKPADKTRYTNLPAYVNAVRTIAQEKNVYLIDHYQYWTDAEQQNSNIKSQWLNDNIHPNYIGSTHMAAAIFKALGLDDPASYISNLRYRVTP